LVWIRVSKVQFTTHVWTHNTSHHEQGCLN
jgi:hypothetical protein